ncbi:hypothetical protein ACTXI9_01615 [Brachybacterium alimentarium]|uniref:hypothetical protein n=1 Tax=Brachybacterium alimentarium TaxID=47845 RepID=UPI003FD0A0A1
MTVTQDGVDTALLRLSRVQMVQLVDGASDEWFKALERLSWLNDDGLEWCVDYFIREGVPGTRFWLRPSDVRDLAVTKRQRIPYHLECRDHPGQYAYECRDCKLQIAPPRTEVVEQVKALARQAKLDTRARDRERADALKRRADEAARRAAEKLEKKRQIEALEARMTGESA